MIHSTTIRFPWRSHPLPLEAAVSRPFQGIEPAGPKGLPLFGSLFGFFSNPIGFHDRLMNEYAAEPIISFRVLGKRYFLINDPKYVKELFVDEHDALEKQGMLITFLKKIGGINLFTADGEGHTNRKHLYQSAFTKTQIKEYTPSILLACESLLRRWNFGETVNIREEMGRLALDVMTRTLFSVESDEEHAELANAFKSVNESFLKLLSPKALLKQKFLGSDEDHFALARETVRSAVRAHLAKRDPFETRKRDILSVLAEKFDGAADTEDEIVNNLLMLFMAGQDTIATALTWAFHALAEKPELQERIRQESEALALGDDSLPDIEAFSFTNAVLKETMRLYPPAWVFSRRATRDIAVGPFRFPKGSIVAISPYMLHRNERFFASPREFSPERWKDRAFEREIKNMYLPFGVGRRVCIGKTFAMAEGILALATILKSVKFSLVESRHPGFRGAMTLQPKKDIFLKIEKHVA